MTKCKACQHAREIIKSRIGLGIHQFTCEHSRKQYYIDNVTKNVCMYDEDVIPVEWVGFVYKTSKDEFKHYFGEDLDDYLSEDVLYRIRDINSYYKYDSSHGSLYHTLKTKILLYSLR